MEVSYPTVRNRLNSVIERIESAKDNEESSLVPSCKKAGYRGKIRFE